jgi:hypothetical protein
MEHKQRGETTPLSSQLRSNDVSTEVSVELQRLRHPNDVLLQRLHHLLGGYARLQQTRKRGWKGIRRGRQTFYSFL